MHFKRGLIAIVLCLIAVPALASNYSSEVLNWNNAALQGYWRMTDASGTTITDFSTAANSGTLHGGVTLGSTALIAGSADTSAAFNGSTGYVSLPSSGVFALDYNQPFTVEFVVRFNALPTAGNGMNIIEKSDPAAASKGYGFYIQNNGGTNVVWYFSMTDGTNFLTVHTTTPAPAVVTGTTYHVVYTYDGSATGAGIKIIVNGVKLATTTAAQTLAASVVNTVNADIGAYANNSSGFVNGNIQEVAWYNNGAVAGFTSGISTAGASLDNLAWYHSQLQQGDAAPIANPGLRPNVFIEDDFAGDIDSMASLRTAIWLHLHNYINIIGIADDDSDLYGASVIRSVLDYWHLDSIPIYAYQGNNSTAHPTFFSQSTATQFRPQDATNVGISSTLGTISVAGTNYQVGDVLTIPGGTVATGFSPATLTVTSVSSGGITGARYSNSGSYTSAPTSPATLPNPHGGTQAVIAFTTCANRCNYTDPASGLVDLFANYSNVIWMNAGSGSVTYALLTNNSALITSKIAAFMPVGAGYAPSNAAFSQSPGFNYTIDPSDWNTIASTWPSTVPIVELGLDDTTPFGTCCANAYVYMGPANVTNKNSDPVQWAFNQWTGGYVSGFLRANWNLGAYLWAAGGGVNIQGGNTFGQYVYYGANQGAESINSSTGANSFALTSGNWSYLRYRATPTQLNALGATIMADVPSNYGMIIGK